MARGVTGYVKQYLNSSASASFTQSVEATTGIPIHTGTNTNLFEEFSDSEAGALGSKSVVGVQVASAGTGQTNGTFTATASTGGAVINYTIAGGLLTAVSVNTPGKYTVDTAPTFTIAQGGTPGTVAVTLGFLYAGVYGWVQLDPAVTGASIPVGTPLYWLQTSLTSWVVTTVGSGNYPDFAGVSIDPNFGPTFPNAFILHLGKVKALFGATGFPAAYGNIVGLAATPGANFTDNTTTPTASTLGLALAVGSASNASLIRITKAQARF